MDKLKVVFIDDEPLVLDMATSMIEWDNSAFELSGTATNGKDGFNLCMKTKPDVAFIDIRMPIMDGLELAQKIKDTGLTTEIIILTAYQDFNYAQQGIKIGIYDYLLKHQINKSSLLNILNSIKTYVDAKRKEDYFSFQSVFSAIIHRAQLNISEISNITGLNKIFLSVLIGQAVQPFSLGERAHKKEHLPLAILPESVTKYFDLDLFTIVEYNNNSQVYLFRNNTISQIKQLNSLYNLEKHIRKLHTSYGGKEVCFLLLSQPVSVYDLCEAVEFGYAELEKEIIRTMRPVTIACFDRKASMNLPGKDGYIDCIDCSYLFKLLRKNNFAEAKEYLLGEFREILKNNLHTVADCERIFNAIISEINLARETRGLTALHYAGINVPNLYTIDNALEWISLQLDSTDNEQKAMPVINSTKLGKAIEYIQANYMKDITQEEVADAAGCSSVYLSVLFRREMNSSFLKYLTDYRVQVAKYLLCNTDRKVCEISKDVGYQTSQYFSQIFRQSVNMTPSEYRKMKECQV